MAAEAAAAAGATVTIQTPCTVGDWPTEPETAAAAGSFFATEQPFVLQSPTMWMFCVHHTVPCIKLLGSFWRLSFRNPQPDMSIVIVMPLLSSVVAP